MYVGLTTESDRKFPVLPGIPASLLAKAPMKAATPKAAHLVEGKELFFNNFVIPINMLLFHNVFHNSVCFNFTLCAKCSFSILWFCICDRI